MKNNYNDKEQYFRGNWVYAFSMLNKNIHVFAKLDGRGLGILGRVIKN